MGATSDQPWTVDRITAALGVLRLEAGNPSFTEIARQVTRRRRDRGDATARVARSTIYDCFRAGRRRLDIDLVVDVVRALGCDDEATEAWVHRLRAAHGAETAPVVVATTGLPSSATDVVGRADEVGAVRDAVVADRPVWIEGMPGVGKSSLAWCSAARLLEEGRVAEVLRVDLRGHRPGQPPADAGAVVGACLRALGVADGSLPADAAAQRTLLDETRRRTRTLLVLDDAASADQAATLLPPRPAAVLVTSRVQNPETQGWESVRTEPLTTAAALKLLTRALGPSLVDAEPAAARELVELTGHLPLLLWLAAARVSARPEWGLVEHVAALRSWPGGGPFAGSVEATLSGSYAGLAEGVRLALRLLAGQPCPALGAPEIAALAGRDMTAELDQLARHHLVLRSGEQFSLHAMVEVFGIGRGLDEDQPSRRREGWARLCDHMTGMVVACRATRHPDEAGPLAETSVDGLGTAEGLAWMSANAANLLTLAAAGPDLGRPRLALDLSAAAGWWFLETGRYAEGCLLHRTALATARSMGERTGPAALALGQALVRLGAWDEALELLPAAERALVADGDGSAHRAANATAIIHAQRGDLDAAIAGFERAATLARGVDDLAAEAQCWDNLAITHRRAGRLPDALAFHHRALAFYDARGDVHEQAHSLVNLSDLLLVMGDVPGALDTAQRGVRRAAEVDAAAWAYGLDNLGNALAATGRVEEAEKSFLAALDKAREQGDKHLEACVLNDLGALCVRDDRFAAAADRHGAALAVSESIEDRFQEARSQEGLGRSRAGESDRVGARTHLSIAVSIFEELGAPEADEARALLAGLG